MNRTAKALDIFHQHIKTFQQDEARVLNAYMRRYAELLDENINGRMRATVIQNFGVKLRLTQEQATAVLDYAAEYYREHRHMPWNFYTTQHKPE